MLRDSLIHFISIYKVRDILRVEALWLQRFIFTAMCLIYRHKSLLGVDQAPNKKLQERIREAIPCNNLKEDWSLQGKAVIKRF